MEAGKSSGRQLKTASVNSRWLVCADTERSTNTCLFSSLENARSRVQGTGFGFQGSGFRVQGAGFRVQGAGFRVQGLGFRVSGVGPNV